jgi:hypothetical protein
LAVLKRVKTSSNQALFRAANQALSRAANQALFRAAKLVKTEQNRETPLTTEAH